MGRIKSEDADKVTYMVIKKKLVELFGKNLFKQYAAKAVNAKLKTLVDELIPDTPPKKAGPSGDTLSIKVGMLDPEDRKRKARGSQAVVDAVCFQLKNGSTFQEIAEGLNSEPADIYKWCDQDPKWSEQVNEALRVRTQTLSDLRLTLAKNIGTIQANGVELTAAGVKVYCDAITKDLTAYNRDLFGKDTGAVLNIGDNAGAINLIINKPQEDVYRKEYIDNQRRKAKRLISDGDEVIDVTQNKKDGSDEDQ